MKKVLIWGMTSNWGGIESVLYNYVVFSDPSKVKYDFITTFSTIPREKELLNFGCHIEHIPERKKNFLGYKKMLEKYMLEKSAYYDAVWLNDCMFANIDILKMAKKYGIEKRIVHAHNANSLGGGKSRLLRHKINVLQLPKYATDYWACSELAGKWTYPEKIMSSKKYRIIPNAIDCEKYSYNPEAREKLRKKFGIEDDVFVIGHIGRFDYQKNHPYLLKVFTQLLKKKENSALVLVGTGTDFEDIKEMAYNLNIKNKVYFLGQRDDVSNLYSMFDVFVLPSRFEGLPVVIVEALAAGLECFVSDNVTTEASIIPERVHYLSIDEPPDFWVDQILQYNGKREPNSNNLLEKKGYNIQTQAIKICELF